MGIAFTGPSVSIGVFTDIQYADKPDQTLAQLYGLPINDHLNQTYLTVRHYTLALEKAAKAINHFNENKVAAVLHLGDIVDGNKTVEKTHKELDAVMNILKALKSPLLHVFGNHCLYVERNYLFKSLNLEKEPYYTFDVSPKWRIIVLDTVDVSVNREPDHPYHKVALDYLALHPEKPNAQTWNGTISSKQKDWLLSTLKLTRKQGKLAVICGHIPIYMSESLGPNPEHVIYDFENVAAMFTDFNDVVKAYFAGHYHQGTYVEKNGIHYVTFESILDSEDPEGAWGLIKLYDDGILIEGHGDMSSRQLRI